MLPRRIAVNVDALANSIGTGAYAYTLEVDAVNGSGQIASAQTVDTLVIVDRSQSPYGAGWWLDGLEQISTATPDTSMRLWIGGDGSTRLYKKSAVFGSTTIWTVLPTVDRPDTLTFDGSVYHRHLRNGAFVEFDAFGRHVRTVSRQGQATVFTPGTTAGSVARIALPSPGMTPLAYTFTYRTDGTGLLAFVDAPPVPQGARRATLSYNPDHTVASITDPDLTVVGFRYDAQQRDTARVDRLGHWTSYAYDNAGTLQRVTVDMSATGEAPIVTTICGGEARGVATCPLPVDVSRTYTLLDGPRADVADTTRFFLNRFGAPDTIVDAIGRQTAIARDSRFPMLAASVTQPNGHVVRAAYTERGLVATETDVSPLDDGRDAITTYFWNPVFDMIDSTIAPTQEHARIGYFGNGDRAYSEDGRGPLSRVSFTYNASRQLATIQQPGNSASQVDSLVYDAALGNLEHSTSPLQQVTSYHTDLAGRVDTVWTPISGPVRRQQSTSYDLMGRVLVSRDSGPAASYSIANANGSAPPTVLVVTNSYDNEGNLLSTMRQSTPSLGGSSLTTTSEYDALHRKRAAADAHSHRETWVYDAAGNDITWTTRRGTTITNTYDAINRVMTHVTPSVSYAPQIGQLDFLFAITSEITKFPYFGTNGFVYDPFGARDATPPALVIAGDTARFTYDITGGIATAIDADARVTRTYYPNGSLATETQQPAAVDLSVTPADDPYAFHKYVLSYAYDLNGRILSRSDSIPGCSPDCVQNYHYDAQSGFLDRITDEGSTFTFAYDAAGRIASRVANASDASETFTYDAASRLTHRSVNGNGGGADRGVYDDILTYDDANRVANALVTSSLPGVSDNSTQAYNGLGAVIAMQRLRNNVAPIDEFAVDAFGNVVSHKIWNGDEQVTETRTYDGDHLSRITQSPTTSIALGNAFIPSIKTLDSTGTVYDNAGNVVFTGTGAQHFRDDPPAWVSNDARGFGWTWNAYSADEKLRVSQQSMWDSTGLRTVFVEHRYDALGRRVLVRTRRDQDCGPNPQFGNCLPMVERVVWDGDQELAEIRAAVYDSVVTGGTTCAPDTAAESCPSGGHSLTRWFQSNLETEFTSGPFSGIVRYTHAGGVDEPLAIWKQNGGGSPFGIAPHRSWRGLYEAGSYLGTNPVNVNWPARNRDAYFAQDARLQSIVQTQWIGGIVDGKTDQSGLMYMRNRFYDPKTGRFTQEDPIGLAGGMNLYGFAGGDPVNYADPLGLFPCDRKTGEGCSKEYKRLLGIDKPLATPLIDPVAIGSGMLAGALIAPGEAAIAGGVAAVRVGQAGEAAVREVAEIGEKMAIRVAGRTRIPDGLTNTVLTEVKNVKSLSFTRQLRDFSQYAHENGLRFDLWVRKGATLSGPLTDAIRSGDVNLRIIP